MCIRSELYIFLLYLLLEGVHYHIHVLHGNRHLIHSDYLHTYRMCIVQLERLDKKDAAVAKRLLADIFWIDVDDRVRELGSTSSTVRGKGVRESWWNSSMALALPTLREQPRMTVCWHQLSGGVLSSRMYSLCTWMYSCVTSCTDCT